MTAASGVYTKAKDLILDGGINLNTTTTTIAAALITNTYTPSFTEGGDTYYSTPSANVISPGLVNVGTANIGVSAGAFTISAATTFNSVASGQTVNQIVLFQNTGTASTSPLICCLSVTAQLANGGNIVVNWPSYVFQM